MATRYHQQAYNHTRPPSRRQPLGPGEARANMNAPAYNINEKAQPNRTTGSQKQSAAADVVDHRSGTRDTQQGKRVSDIRSEGHNTKRDSEISNASSTGSNGGRKRTIGQWQLGRTIGRGGCSTVRLVRHVVTGQQGAVKIISRKMAEQVRAQSLANLAASQEKSVQDLVAAGKMLAPPPPGLMREIAIMKLLDHPNIVRLFDVWESHNELYLVMEYVQGGELFHYVEECRGLDEKETVYIFRQIVAALLYCHRMHIHHRDLKPENILLDRENAQIKLVDFGMAAFQPEGKLLTTACGSPHYAAPEVINSRPYDGAKADVWSCGVILYVMLTGTTPFNYNHERNLRVMYEAIKAADYYMPPELSFHAKDLLRKIFVTRPDMRISMDEIWDHPLLHKYDGDFGYEGDLAKKERWIGPAATLDEWTVEREQDLDKEIIRNIRTLWHSVPQDVLVAKLMSKELNQERLFYRALMKHKEENLENYTGGNDGMSYSTSDIQHALKNGSTSEKMPSTKQSSQSSYSIMNNEHLRSSSVVDRMPGDIQNEANKNRPPLPNANRTSHIPRPAGHERGNSGSTTASALRVEMLKKANSQARHARGPSNHVTPAASAMGDAQSRPVSRNSRQSLTSSVWPSSPPVTVHVKPNTSHKRNVSFQHHRKHSNVNSASTGQTSQATKPVLQNDGERNAHDKIENTSTNLESPTRAGRDNSPRRSKVPTGSSPRSKPRTVDYSKSFIRTEVRKVSSELEKACEEAFFRSSYGSSQQTIASTITDRQSQYDTPPSSVSNYAATNTTATTSAAGLQSPRPLPAVPSDPPDVFITRTLEETRQKLAAQASGEGDASRINEVLASLDKIIPGNTTTDAERRSTSAPEPKSNNEVITLPPISEEQQSQHLQPLTLQRPVSADNNRQTTGSRSFTMPGQARMPSFRNGNDTIRVVEQSPSFSQQTGLRHGNSTTEKEVAYSRPKTSDGGHQQSDQHLQVPNPYDQLLRKKSYDSAIGLRPTVTEEFLQPPQRPELRKGESWFRRWKKTPVNGHGLSQVSATEPHPGVPVNVGDVDLKAKPSLLKRDKQAPQALDLSRPVLHSGPSTDSSDFPLRRTSDGEPKTFSKWLNKLGKKDDSRVTEIRDPLISPNTPSYNPQQSTQQGQQQQQQQQQQAHNNDLSPTTAHKDAVPVQAHSWFARFFRVVPESHVTAFCVSRGRARNEIYKLFSDSTEHGIKDLCYLPQENIIMARVDKLNALGIRPVTFRIEFFVVLQHGKRSGLSVARWSQVRGAASGFHGVVESVEQMLMKKALLVEDEERRRELVGIILD